MSTPALPPTPGPETEALREFMCIAPRLDDPARATRRSSSARSGRRAEQRAEAERGAGRLREISATKQFYGGRRHDLEIVVSPARPVVVSMRNPRRRATELPDVMRRPFRAGAPN